MLAQSRMNLGAGRRIVFDKSFLAMTWLNSMYVAAIACALTAVLFAVSG